MLQRVASSVKSYVVFRGRESAMSTPVPVPVLDLASDPDPDQDPNQNPVPNPNPIPKPNPYSYPQPNPNLTRTRPVFVAAFETAGRVARDATALCRAAEHAGSKYSGRLYRCAFLCVLLSDGPDVAVDALATFWTLDPTLRHSMSSVAAYELATGNAHQFHFAACKYFSRDKWERDIVRDIRTHVRHLD